MKYLTATIVLFLPSLVLAWGGDGHQIVALIAEERLTPQAEDEIHKLLGKNEHGQDYDISDGEIASWADEIKRTRRVTAPWHYVNISTTQPGYDTERDGNHGNNVIDAISRFEKVLADKSKTKEERAEALKYIVHFVGDIEQPLHCADRDKDKGGNGRLVFFLDRPKATNLHSVWDTAILLSRKGTVRISKYAQELNTKISEKQADLWSKGTPEDWANESHAIAIAVVYKDIPPGGDPPKIDQAYVDRAGPVIDEQLERGGVRLAAILNRIFVKQ